MNFGTLGRHSILIFFCLISFVFFSCPNSRAASKRMIDISNIIKVLFLELCHSLWQRATARNVSYHFLVHGVPLHWSTFSWQHIASPHMPMRYVMQCLLGRTRWPDAPSESFWDGLPTSRQLSFMSEIPSLSSSLSQASPTTKPAFR